MKPLDKEKIKSLIKSSETDANIAKNISLNESSATIIFREMYESIRQLGEAYWLAVGYEPLNHEISLEILKELDIKNKIKLNNLSRFKQIRHDANYKGFRSTASQAKEIIEFWELCSKDIINSILNHIK